VGLAECRVKDSSEIPARYFTSTKIGKSGSTNTFTKSHSYNCLLLGALEFRKRWNLAGFKLKTISFLHLPSGLQKVYSKWLMVRVLELKASFLNGFFPSGGGKY